MIGDVVDTFRDFNRFYTGVIGILGEGLLDTPYSLTEARVLFELAQRDSCEVAELRRTLGIDAGYLSRMLARFAADGLVSRERSATDARRQVIRLTKSGRATFGRLNTRSIAEIERLLAGLGEDERRRLLAAMGTIRQLLEPAPRTLTLRAPVPGDLGWVIYRHGARYAAEYDWDATFETLVARILAEYAERDDQTGERGWIAEVDGEPVGCVFCMRHDDDTAQLRLLLVEPGARGLGIGGALVEACLEFARDAGYRRITLWTNDVLTAARRIYEKAGFTLDDASPHHSFGHDLIGQTWSRPL
jgi:DNA-binding MarR family transcriptional regulator/GNAT superfamily N-acetyltransferase